MRIDIARGIVKLGNLPEGSLFIYKDTIALKTEYRNNNGACLSYIVGTGETFWGGTTTARELNNLYVTPILINKGD